MTDAKREIKFRAWDKENKKMLVQSPYMSFHLFHITPNGHVYKQGKIQDYILLQYTGLKDKNGKEIYEGDIVRFFDIPYGQDDVDFIEDIVVVQFEKGRFHKADRCWRDFKNAGEVIGNIYENTELLEG